MINHKHKEFSSMDSAKTPSKLSRIKTTVRRRPVILLIAIISIGVITLIFSQAATIINNIQLSLSSCSTTNQCSGGAVSATDGIEFRGTAPPPPLTSQTPSTMAIYYGDPARVNNANGNLTTASDIFRAYNMVIFGEGIEQTSHAYHTNTRTIMQNISANTDSYGYVDACVENPQSSLYRCSNFSLTEMRSRIDRWKSMGAKGIFLDQAGCEYMVTRDRLNSLVDYIHSVDMSAFVNVWNVPEAFEPGLISSPYPNRPNCNPNRLPTRLNANDYVLLESWAVVLSDWSENWSVDRDSMKRRGEQMVRYKNQYGTKVATVNTIGYSNPPFSQAQLNYVWWSTLVYGFDAMAWGETWVFSSDTNALPYRTRPNPTNLGNKILPITFTTSGNFIRRTTTTGTIQLDTSAHTGTFY
jgi:hypothetical protein